MPQPPAQMRISMLTPGNEGQTLGELGKQLVFSREVVTTTLRPDIVMWSTVKVIKVEMVGSSLRIASKVLEEDAGKKLQRKNIG